MGNSNVCVKFRIRKFPGSNLLRGWRMTHKQEPMLRTVLRRLDQVKGDWPRIAEESDVPYQTITKIGGRFVTNPRVDTVQALFDYFAGLPEQPATADSAHTAH
jgi:hypothetical protein